MCVETHKKTGKKNEVGETVIRSLFIPLFKPPSVDPPTRRGETREREKEKEREGEREARVRQYVQRQVCSRNRNQLRGGSLRKEKRRTDTEGEDPQHIRGQQQGSKCLQSPGEESENNSFMFYPVLHDCEHAVALKCTLVILRKT